VRQLVSGVVAQAEPLALDPQIEIPLEAPGLPVLVPLVVGVPGFTKNSISICSNSRVRKMKLPGVISLRKALPIWAMPKGTFMRAEVATFRKFAKIPCAVSGRRKQAAASSSTGPMNVLNMRLNWRASVSSPPHSGQWARSSRWSARKRFLHALQSTSGSVKPSTWPLASQTLGCMRIEQSIPTMSSRARTTSVHHASLTLRLSSEPSGP